MTSVTSFRLEFAESAELSEQVVADLDTILGIIGTAGTAVSLINDFNAQLENTADGLDNIAAGLRLLSFVPVSVVSTPANQLLNATSVVQQQIKLAGDAAEEVRDPLLLLDTFLTRVGLAALAGREIAAENADVQGAREDAIGRLDEENVLAPADPAIAVGGATAADAFALLSFSNDQVAAALEQAEPARELFEDMNLAALTGFEQALKTAGDIATKIDSALNPVEEVVDAFLDAIGPVRWAFDAPSEVLSEVLNPVVDAALEATGLTDFLDDLVSNLVPDELRAFSEVADEVLDELAGVDVGQRTEDFFDALSSIVAPAGPIAALSALQQVSFENESGTVVVIGSDNDDVIVHGNDPDTPALDRPTEFIGLGGDDTLVGGTQTDRAWYFSDITDYRVELVDDPSGGDVLRVSERGPGAEGDGRDILRDVELLRFDTEGLGDVRFEDVRDFRYTEPGEPDLIGDDDTDWLFGDDGANALSGNGGDDRLFGGRGDDRLIGGRGSDSVFGGDGDDTILVDVRDGAGIDVVFGGEGTDRLSVVSDDAITVDFGSGGIDYGPDGIGIADGIEIIGGTQFADTYIGSDAAETVFSGGGADSFLRAGHGDFFEHSLIGSQPAAAMSFAGGDYEGSGVRVDIIGTGPDGETAGRHSATSDPARFNEGAAPANLVNIAIFEGTGSADVFYALGSAQGDTGDGARFDYVFQGETLEITGNVFLGGGGTDVFFGSEKAHLFVGGEGFDLLNYSLDAIEAFEVSDSGIQDLVIDLSAGTVASRFNANAAQPDRLDGIEGIVGSRGSDSIIGDDGANYLFGYQGSDTILGNGGDDYIDATDLVNAKIDAGDGDDIVALFNSENAIIEGGAGIDALELERDTEFRLDRFFESKLESEYRDPEFAFQGWTVDLAAGTTLGFFRTNQTDDGGGSETNAVSGFENVLGSALGDTISGDAGTNVLVGRDGDDSLDGRAGDDILVGGQGSDTLVGGDGDDTLVANGSGLGEPAAQDILTGGEGADVFGIETQSGAIIVTDFVAGVDLLDIRATGATFDDLTFFAEAPPPLSALAALIDIPPAQQTEVSLNGEVIAILQGVRPEDITEQDVIIATQAGADAFALDLATTSRLPDLLANDTASSVADDGNAGLSIVEINGTGIAPGGSVRLDNGTFINMADDGGLSLGDPDGVLAGLIGGGNQQIAFNYTVIDDAGGRDEGAVDMTVSHSTTPIAANDDTATTDEDTQVLIDPLLNDSGAGLAVASASARNGTVEIVEETLLLYTPDADFYGTDIVDYTVEDAFGQFDTGRIEVDVEAVNDAPTAAEDDAETEFETAVDIDVLANDTDVDGDTLTLLSAAATNGRATITEVQTISYQPDKGFSGEDIITYLLSDGTDTAEGRANVAVSTPGSGTDGEGEGDDQPDGNGTGSGDDGSAAAGLGEAFSLAAGLMLLLALLAGG